ncbi:MAG: ribonuclease H-like domain-containing protein, partial [Armatimonadetes bacterium]|nr:ribonuclease H-like domain-containing protein [Armatimonadota bacterium]
ADTVWGGREQQSPHGPFYIIDRPVTTYDGQASSLAERLENALQNPPSQWLSGLSPRDLLFVDIETTGLSSSEPLFLIGTMTIENDAPRLQLYLARDLDEEKAVLSAFGAKMRGKTLVTFNGKSFDWPFIEARATRKLLKLPQPQGHFDLLFAARRRWRSEMPNCKLQTLEMGVCKRARQGDIPSSRIPERYYDFLEMSETKGAGAHLLAPVLFHNALDVLTMAELICCLSEGK